MRTPLRSKRAAVALACALACASFSTVAAAQTAEQHALVTDSAGGPVMSGSGLCVHSGFGPAPSWTAACGGAIAPVAQYTAPRVAALAAPAPAPAYEKVVFDANVLFDSNKADLRPAGQDTLDTFVGKLRGLESQSVMAIGYADRMGGESANQLLSEERVAAVKSYLVGKGVGAERIETSGRGETRPTTLASECADANNTKNVACMQPDRHVFIEISGTRLAQ